MVVVASIRAFVRMGFRAAFSYPLSFILGQLSTIVALLGFYFLGRLTRHTGDLGEGYLAFATTGLVAMQLVSAGVLGLGQELDLTIQQGRLEMLLVEPLPWRLIPVALSTWPTIYRVVTATIAVLVACGLGANLSLPIGEVPSLLSLVMLGILSGLAIGVAAGALRVIAKRSDPIAALYMMGATVLTGQLVPINVLPAPLRIFAWVFPNTYLNSGLRKLLLPGSAQIYGPNPSQAMLLLMGFCVVMLPIGLWLFGRSLEVGRRYGVLAGY